MGGGQGCIYLSQLTGQPPPERSISVVNSAEVGKPQYRDRSGSALQVNILGYHLEEEIKNK